MTQDTGPAAAYRTLGDALVAYTTFLSDSEDLDLVTALMEVLDAAATAHSQLAGFVSDSPAVPSEPPRELCDTCGGGGQLRTLRLPEGAIINEICPRCGGNGAVATERWESAGSGTVTL